MSLMELVKTKRDEILRLAAHHGARNVRVFGSVARGEARSDSDVDLLVAMAAGRTLLDRIGLWQDLEELLGNRVHVVNERALHWCIRDRVLKEAAPL
ncbi:MAG: nucleotidyltransferase family protein [Deltaproteobacteria bacterium]|nr:nucleotidyltransferase family protein [Deltaproteobacteria bacterium]